jgi:hypothetical protein
MTLASLCRATGNRMCVALAMRRKSSYYLFYRTGGIPDIGPKMNM